MVHPEKTEVLSQFLLCMGTFTLAAVMFYLAISRGRAFINISQARAQEVEIINTSIDALEGLQTGFQQLTVQFDSLYRNIEEQNRNVNQVDSIFEQLKDKVGEISNYSQENQSVVEAITEALEVYRDNRKQVIDDTMQIHEVSASMLKVSKNQTFSKFKI